MPILVVDGPEKAGKSSLLSAVEATWRAVGKTTLYRGWHGPANDRLDTRNLSALIQDVKLAQDADTLVLWSRSWACENVYGTLLGRDSSDLVNDPWLGEWFYGRAVQTLGKRVMLLPTDIQNVIPRRNASDHPVNARLEMLAFKSYAAEFGWDIMYNDYTSATLRENADAIISGFANDTALYPLPPAFAGPKDADVILVGERRFKRRSSASWLPFSEELELTACRALGGAALRLAYAVPHELPPHLLRRAKVLVACGPRAEQWCDSHVDHRDIRHAPHPATGKRDKFLQIVSEALTDATKASMKKESKVA